MELIKYRKTLDVHKNGVQFLLQGFETADKLSRVIEISLMASGDAIDFPLESIVAVMYVTTPGATGPSIIECTIKDNKVVYDVLPIVEEGITTMQLKLIETSAEGAKRVLASPKFAVEVSKSDTNEEEAEQTVTYTAIEQAIAMSKEAYGKRLERIELSSDCIFRAFYADETIYETDILKKLFLNGNVELSKSYAVGGTGVRAGEDTDNSKYYSNVSKSESLNAKAIMDNSKEILEEVKLHGIYTAFSVDFETGTVEYVSPSFKFNVDLETGELEAEGQAYTFNDEVYRVVEDWLKANGISLTDLQNHAEKISELQNKTKEHKETLDKNTEDIEKLISIPTYLTFVGNVNSTMLDAAFGKNNEDSIVGIGNALNLYAKFKGDTTDNSYLTSYDKFVDIINEHKQNLVGNSILFDLIKTSPYALDVAKNTNVGLPDIVLFDSGTSEHLNFNNASTNHAYSGNTTSVTTDGKLTIVHKTTENANPHTSLTYTVPLIKSLNLSGYKYFHIKMTNAIVKVGYGGIGLAEYRVNASMGSMETEIFNKNDATSVNSNYNEYSFSEKVSTKDCFVEIPNEGSFDNLVITIFSPATAGSPVTSTINIEKIWFSET